MKYALIFACISIVCVVEAVTAANPFAKILFACVAVAYGGVASAYAMRKPSVLMKRADGRLSAWSYVPFWPYFLLNNLILEANRRFGNENAFDCVSRGLYLGGRLNRKDGASLTALGVLGVLDVTAEFGEVEPLRVLSGYRCLPLLDATAPTLEQLREALHWLEQEMANGPVYVHCAYGHGRSAAIVAAYLIYVGEVATVDEAIARIKTKRPKIALTPPQMRLLQEFREADYGKPR